MRGSSRRRGIAVFVILAFIVVLSQVAPRHRSKKVLSSMSDSGFAAHLDRRVPALMEEYSVPGVGVLWIRGGESSWSRAYGFADREVERSLTTGTTMMAHSISKSVTAWGVMKLVQEGAVGLDDPVGRHIDSWTFPESGFHEDDVTIRRLLANSAGVPLGSLGLEYSPTEEIPRLSDVLTGDEVRLVRPPGSAFGYSNSGFGVLELLVEEVTRRDFAEYMREEVLLPLDMRSSTFAWSDVTGSDIATGYDLRGNPVPPFLYPNRASGGLLTTLDDLGRFVAAGMVPSPPTAEHSVLAPELVAELYTPQVSVGGMFGLVTDAYGLGHFVERLADGRTAVWHGGQGHGWMTDFHSVPATGDGIVILSNSQRSWPLMAQILEDWSRWRGFGPVGFSRITAAVTGLRVLVGLVFLVTVWQAWRVGRGLATGRRTLRLSAAPSPASRVAHVVGAAALLGVLLWSVSQEYLFVSSVFPGGSVWLGVGLLLLALVLLGSAMLPVVAHADGAGG